MRKTSKLLLILLLASIVAVAPLYAAPGDEEYTATVKKYLYRMDELTVIGTPTWHKVSKKDTMLELARRYGLGYNEVDLVYPRMDGWVPPLNRKLLIPTLWVLPPTQHEQLVINIAEMRLYFFDKASGTVQTNPIGIGDEGWESPLGTWHITEKRPNPSWYIPQSLQAKYGMAVMPPGPENPLGDFMMKFSAGAYGIHGTAMPWGVGRLVSHGCIRCYPEHIKILFPQVSVGTKLEVIYEPIKFGRRNGQVYVEVHPDVYRKMENFEQYATDKLNRSLLADQIDIKRYQVAVKIQSGVPTDITKFPLKKYSD